MILYIKYNRKKFFLVNWKGEALFPAALTRQAALNCIDSLGCVHGGDFFPRATKRKEKRTPTNALIWFNSLEWEGIRRRKKKGTEIIHEKLSFHLLLPQKERKKENVTLFPQFIPRARLLAQVDGLFLFPSPLFSSWKREEISPMPLFLLHKIKIT